MDQLNEFDSLQECIKLYIPSTTETDKEALELQAVKVNQALELFGNLFGGATSNEATGSWLSETRAIVKEKVIQIESFTNSETIEKNISKVLGFCKEMKRTMSQESIALEVNRRLYFV